MSILVPVHTEWIALYSTLFHACIQRALQKRIPLVIILFLVAADYIHSVVLILCTELFHCAMKPPSKFNMSLVD